MKGVEGGEGGAGWRVLGQSPYCPALERSSPTRTEVHLTPARILKSRSFTTIFSLSDA